MKPVLILLCFLAMACLLVAPVDAGCDKNKCTLEVTATADIQLASNPVAHAATRAAGRSVAAVRKVASAPAKLVKSIAQKKPIRSAAKKLAAIRPAKAVAVGGARLLCHRVGSRR